MTISNFQKSSSLKTHHLKSLVWMWREQPSSIITPLICQGLKIRLQKSRLVFVVPVSRPQCMKSPPCGIRGEKVNRESAVLNSSAVFLMFSLTLRDTKGLHAAKVLLLISTSNKAAHPTLLHTAALQPDHRLSLYEVRELRTVGRRVRSRGREITLYLRKAVPCARPGEKTSKTRQRMPHAS